MTRRAAFAMITVIAMVVGTLVVPQAYAEDSIDGTTVQREDANEWQFLADFEDTLLPDVRETVAYADLSCTNDDLAGCITGASLKGHNGDFWFSLDDPNNPVSEIPNKVRMELSYTLKPGIISPSNPSVSYQLPSAFLDDQGRFPGGSTNGFVHNTTQKQVGHYTIDEHGKVHVTFTDAEFLNSTVDIRGTFFVEREKWQIKLDEEIKVSESVSVSVAMKPSANADLSMSKRVERQTDDAATFVIELTSNKGSNSDIQLTDEMTKLIMASDSSIQIVDAGGNAVQPAIDRTDNGFSMSLPALGKNGKYSLTYTAKLDPSEQSLLVQGKNKATASWTDAIGQNHSIDAFVDVTFDRRNVSLHKSAVTDRDKGIVQWTISIDVQKDGALDGWTLSDVFNGHGISVDDLVPGTDFTLRTPDGHTTTLQNIDGHGFEDTKQGTYTLSYQTPINTTVGAQSVNKVTLTPPNSSDGTLDSEAKGDDYIGADSAYALNKSGNITTVNSDGTGILEWTVKLSTQDRPLPAQWVLADDAFVGEHSYTAAQITAMLGNMEAAMNRANYSSDYTLLLKGTDWKEYHSVAELGDNRARWFRITFAKDLPANSTLEFSFFSTTADKADGTAKREYKNKVEVESGAVRLHAEAQVAVETTVPTIEKRDLYSSAQGDTTHPYVEDLHLGWSIAVHIPKHFEAGDITVTDTLPEGLANRVHEARIVLPTGNDSRPLNLSNGRIENQAVDFGQGAITITMSSGTLQVLFPSIFTTQHKDNTVAIELVCNLPENFVAPSVGETYAFPNTAQMRWNDRTAQASQSQTITAQAAASAISKQWLGSSTNGNISSRVDYRVNINPGAKELLTGSDVLTLTDKVTYRARKWDNNGAMKEVQYMTLIPESLAMYAMNADGSKGDQLDMRDFPYIYIDNEKLTNPQEKNRNTISMQIPDNTALVLEYAYKAEYLEELSQGSWKEDLDATNTAALEGTAYSESVQVSGKVDSGASARLDGIQGVKVDADNHGLRLGGATFHLERYTGGKWVPVGESMTSGNDGSQLGKFTVREHAGDSKCELLHRKAYRLVEDSAPAGYDKSTSAFEFILDEDCNDCGEREAPAGFNGASLVTGATIYLENHRSSIRIRVRKQWYQETADNRGAKSVEDITATYEGAVTFDLYKHTNTKRHNVKVTGVSSWNNQKYDHLVNTEYPSGSDLTLTAVVPEGNKKDMALYCNGKVVQNANHTITTHPDDNTKLRVEIRMKVHDDMHLAFKLPYEPVTPRELEVAVSSQTPIQTKVGTYTVSSENNWALEIDNLPKRDESGAMLAYSIAETSHTPAQIVNNGGISAGTISMRNVRQIDDEPPVTLPSTGGNGWARVLPVFGVITITCVMAAYLTKSSSCREELE
ncbi:MAG: hypothetical protein SO053_03795 [Bifidobacterium animalis]|nr:hypothetical protein [Bifidobacterium animalis]MDY5040265.1 hypothetical protein [Bifidobacterium animalis]